jgi:UDP-glucose:(heptosyl)LPS alpha-1,3-glucosyltransferase
MHVVYNGVDVERFHPSRHAEPARVLRRALTSRSGPVWLLAGSGARRKGLDTALAALATSSTHDAELWIAGRDDPSPWQRRARALGILERVRFLGARTDMHLLYAAADGLLLPTRYDPFSNACLEAAASGRPVISSRANGAMELLETAGRVIEDAEDIRAFAQALDELGDPATRHPLGETARKIAEGNDWPLHVRRLRALHRQCAESRARRMAAGAAP